MFDPEQAGQPNFAKGIAQRIGYLFSAIAQALTQVTRAFQRPPSY